MNAMQPPQSVEEVKATLETTEKGGVRQSIRNCLTVFQRDPVLAGAIAYNILTDRKDIIKPIGFHRESTALTDTDMKYLLLYVFNHQSNVDIDNRIVCYDIKELGKQLKKIGMLVVQDQVWNRVTINRAAHKSTRYYIDEMHLLLKEEQTAAYTVEIWKRFRKWGGIPTGITQNVKDLLSSREVENIFENSDFVYMLNQAGGDRQILAKQLGISTHQLSYVTHSGEGEGLLFYGSTILPFVDHFPKNTELYRIMTTKPQELKKEDE